MPTIPTATDSDGNVKYTWVSTIASTSAPTVAELTAGTELSCWLTGDGWNPSLNQATATDKRACSAQDYEAPGRYAYSLEVKYVEAPQGTNTAKTTLVPGSLGYMVERRGLSVDTAYAAAQKVNVFPVSPGQYMDLPPEDNSKFKGQQKLFVRAAVVIDAVVAA
jgi:hypothetical protein